eukprot:TRINITY_DN2309_c0_g3_i2.p1 TRINITY_DN2309_c0_g3~~TRINITY_DN2309_c0_g3_i2.p1  ORF type:complete len:259 (-),score=48.97 TRINITY_DN2309_c0_g3_i2:241-903(-)
MASVVLEIGRRWTKAGLSKESCPRLVEPTPPPLRRLIDEHGSRPSWDEYPGLVDGEEILTRHLRDLFLTKLFVSPPKCTVFVSLSMTSVHSHWETLLRHVLRERLFVPDVQFLSTQIASLLSVGVTSGVVVDIGWRDEKRFEWTETERQERITAPEEHDEATSPNESAHLSSTVTQKQCTWEAIQRVSSEISRVSVSLESLLHLPAPDIHPMMDDSHAHQ